MAKRVAVATCDEYPDVLDDDRLIVPHLSRLGVETEAAIWSDRRVDWSAYDAELVRSTWDYHTRLEEFVAWLRALEARRVRVLNPVRVMLGNTDKVYLRELEREGVPTVPTMWLDKGDLRPAAELLRGLRWDDVVVKPSVSAGAFRTLRTTRAELLKKGDFLHELLRDAHGMVQPFMREIVETGEWSFLFFGDEFSHAVVKEPKAGDFRVQFTHGGRHAKRVPPAAVLRQVEAILPRLPAGRLYTRVDGIVRDGVFLLVEVELIEPFLFLEEDLESAGRLAAALAERL
jgi:glutathione synthase/RimK-type ligase-like ATP-grasp enzyme